MDRKRYTPEQIINMLCEAKVLHIKGSIKKQDDNKKANDSGKKEDQ